MLTAPQTVLASPTTPSQADGSRPFEVLYVTSRGFRGFEQRLLEVLRPFGSLIRLTHACAGELARFTGDRTFLSTTLPNVVLIKAGEIVAATIGELPSRELVLLLSRALRCTR